MFELVIFIIISLTVIILVECVSYIRGSRKNYIVKKIKNKKTDIIEENTDSDVLLDKYSTNSDVQISHLPGKFSITGYNNVFIKINEMVIIPDDNVVYNLRDPFILEIINLKQDKIIYHYKKL